MSTITLPLLATTSTEGRCKLPFTNLVVVCGAMVNIKKLKPQHKNILDTTKSKLNLIDATNELNVTPPFHLKYLFIENKIVVISYILFKLCMMDNKCQYSSNENNVRPQI